MHSFHAIVEPSSAISTICTIFFIRYQPEYFVAAKFTMVVSVSFSFYYFINFQPYSILRVIFIFKKTHIAPYERDL